jgi:hypothetical protein
MKQSLRLAQKQQKSFLQKRQLFVFRVFQTLHNIYIYIYIYISSTCLCSTSRIYSFSSVELLITVLRFVTFLATALSNSTTTTTTMFTTKFAVNSLQRNRSTAWRSFSKTTATFADQYDVVIVGKFLVVK